VISWVLLVAGTVLAVELFLRLPIVATARRLLGTARKAQRTIRSPRVSDHWKEKVLLAYAGRLFVSSLVVCGLIVLAVLPFVLLAMAGAWLGIDVAGRMMQATGIAVSVVVASGYIMLRRRPRNV
jgi:hypothetical protein